MGGSASQLERDIRSFEKEYGSDFPVNEHYFGLVNFGNTCYCNSVLQALYFCRPFREKVLEYKAKNKKNREETLLTCLADLFQNIATQKKKTGTVAPKKFITRLRKENVVFDNFHQQDAHEFLNYLLNTIGDLLNNEKNEKSHCNSNHNNGGNLSGHTLTTANNLNNTGANTTPNGTNGNSNCTTNNSSAGSVASTNTGASTNNHFTFSFNTMSNCNPNTWVHDIFKGTLTNETRCLNCECLSSKDEDFLDLSVDIRQNTSITQCLNDFSEMETLSSEHKYYCENCCSKQEAQKRMRIKKLPMILALHLKRFKYMESQSRHTKLSHRVVFPLELRLFHRTNDVEDKLYDLVAVVIHCGPGPNRGHYISIVKSFGFWLLFDDDLVEKIEPSGIEEFFGLTSDNQKTSETGYILFYQSREDPSPSSSASASANNSSNASYTSTTPSTTSNNSFSSTSACSHS